MSASPTPDSELAAFTASQFATALRRAGLAAPLSSVLAFAEMLLALGEGSRSSWFYAGRACFVHGPEDLVAYEAGFASYFERDTAPGPGDTFSIVYAAPAIEPEAVPPEGDEDGEETALASGMTFSAMERLSSTDFAELSDSELAEAMALLSTVRRELATRRTRRLGPGRRGRLDLRRSVASAVSRDGEVLERVWLERRERPRRIAMLCDVSGSMEPYSRAMLRFAHVLAMSGAPIEVFAIGTRLTRLTRRLSSRDPSAALAAATAAIPDYSGGTRLGEALGTFNDHFGVRGAARGATVVICSDGIDRGAPELIAAEMARLARVAERIVWVNPLAASPGYEPLARGMAAAFPYVDEFLPGESLDALGRVARSLARGGPLGRGAARPVRAG